MELSTLYPQSQMLFLEIKSDGRVQQYLDGIRSHHEETYHHLLRVGLLSIDVGFENTVTPYQLHLLGFAGILHDVGKMHIPSYILEKDGPLDEQERAEMLSHSRLGFLALQNFGDKNLGKIVVAHHEFQPQAYPRSGVDRRKIPRNASERRETDLSVPGLAQIVAAADVFDALSCRRSYKDPLPPERVEEILRKDYGGNPAFIDQVMKRKYIST